MISSSSVRYFSILPEQADHSTISLARSMTKIRLLSLTCITASWLCGQFTRANVRPLCEARTVTPLAAGTDRGHFLTFEMENAQAIHNQLARANIITDVRGRRLRFGFGCYHTAEEIESAVAAIARAIT